MDHRFQRLCGVGQGRQGEAGIRLAVAVGLELDRVELDRREVAVLLQAELVAGEGGKGLWRAPQHHRELAVEIGARCAVEEARGDVEIDRLVLGDDLGRGGKVELDAGRDEIADLEAHGSDRRAVGRGLRGDGPLSALGRDREGQVQPITAAAVTGEDMAFDLGAVGIEQLGDQRHVFHR
jgi:hypothetical protein